ncbi:hypothetical protein Droror1_Dr00026858, partial [Drosera rotundifolia]
MRVGQKAEQSKRVDDSRADCERTLSIWADWGSCLGLWGGDSLVVAVGIRLSCDLGCEAWLRCARQENGFSKQKALARHGVSPAVATLSLARLFSGTKACCPALLLSSAQSAVALPPFPLHARQREMKPHQAKGYASGNVEGRHERV